MTNNDPERATAGMPDDRGAANHVIGSKVLDHFDFLANTVPGSPLERQNLAELARTLDQYDLSADLEFVLNVMKAGQWHA